MRQRVQAGPMQERCEAMAAGSIHLWACQLAPGDAVHLPGLLGLLDATEAERARRFVFARDRLSYAAAHALLRCALARLIGPGDRRFVADAFGKPRLNPPHGTLHFSLTHTEGLAAVALADGIEPGVDAEPLVRDVDEAALASLALSPEEITDLDAAADRRGRLLRLWVAKEAVAKAIGLGLSLPFAEIVLRGEPPRLRSLPAGHGDATDWWLSVERQGQHWLALASQGPPARVERVSMTVCELVSRGGT